VAEELLALRLLSLHNVRFLVKLAETARARIRAGDFESWSRDWLEQFRGVNRK
jgi:queuine tRNA-ribosyltransferase